MAAELQTCDPEKVPRTREEIREYFESVRPRLAASEATQAMMEHLLNAEVMFPPLPAILRPGARVVNRVLRNVSTATFAAVTSGGAPRVAMIVNRLTALADTVDGSG